MLEERKRRSLAQPRRVAEYARLFLTGCAMGAADLVPGVSGGTMAFVLGVYQDLLDGIRAFNLDALRLTLRLRLRALEQQVPLRFLFAQPPYLRLQLALLAPQAGNLRFQLRLAFAQPLNLALQTLLDTDPPRPLSQERSQGGGALKNAATCPDRRP